MGVNNRERRRAKKHKRQRAEAARGVPGREAPRRSGPGDGSRSAGFDERMVREAVLATAEAYRFESQEAFASGLEALAVAEAFVGRTAVDGAVQWWMERALDRAWNSGWQPADVVRIVRRRLGVPHAGAVAGAVAASAARRPEAAADERWAAQAAAIAADAGSAPPRRPWPEHLGLAVQALSLVLHLPPLPRLAPSPANGRAGGRSGTVLERVRALLAKAESTTFAEEAEALTAKAQELMARHAIDEAMLDAAGGGAPSAVAGRRIGVEDPYAAAKSVLLDRVATANRCRSVWSGDMGFSTVFGTPGDLDIVEVLFTSLLVQGTDAMVGAGRSVDRSGRSRTRSFRQSFLLAYAMRIGERLAATTEEAVAEAVGRHGDALLPVLAGRAGAVDDAVAEVFPDMVSRGLAITNGAGWVAGRTAADLATLAVGDELAAG